MVSRDRCVPPETVALQSVGKVVAPQMFPLLPVAYLIKFHLCLPPCLVVPPHCPRNGAGEAAEVVECVVPGNPGELLLGHIHHLTGITE